MSAYVIAYDVGTTGLKTCLFEIDKKIKPIVNSYGSYNLYILENGGAEQDAEEWWNAMCTTTKEIFTKTDIKPEQIAGISFCSQMQALVLVDKNGDPDFEAGPQDTDLPYGQGCVIVSSSSKAEYTSAGEVDSIKREFKVTINTRKMMGNVLPRTVQLSEIKQTVGDPGDLTFCTYNENVTRTASYQFFSTEATGGELPEGWYILDKNGDPDFEAGPQDVPLPSGQGFVIVSSSSNAVLQFPKAIVEE